MTATATQILDVSAVTDNPVTEVSTPIVLITGADSIDDMAILWHGGMGKVFDAAYAPSTLGSFLCTFTFGHVRQLDAVASRLLCSLAGSTPVLDGIDGDVLVDTGGSIIEVHGYAKQAAVSSTPGSAVSTR